MDNKDSGNNGTRRDQHRSEDQLDEPLHRPPDSRSIEYRNAHSLPGTNQAGTGPDADDEQEQEAVRSGGHER